MKLYQSICMKNNRNDNIEEETSTGVSKSPACLFFLKENKDKNVNIIFFTFSGSEQYKKQLLIWSVNCLVIELPGQ